MGFDLTPPVNTRSKIFEAYEAAREAYEPVGINVGDLGIECDRALWYSLRRVSEPEKFDGRKLRIFETGNIEEERILADLRAVGCDVRSEQARVYMVGGHVRGKIDAECVGVPEAPVAVHVVECKSSNDRGFKPLQKDGVQKAKPLHYAQCQTYMHARGVERALYVCVNKNDDDIYVERIHYDAEFCLRLLARAERIINADDPPSRICEKPTIPPCVFCRHKDVCHEGAWPRNHCRTCIFSTPNVSGENADWSCGKHHKPLTLVEQAAGCEDHLFLPGVVPGKQVDAGDDWVSYELRDGKTWVDGKGAEHVDA